MEEKAARAYDLAALKYWGPSTHINFPVKILFCLHFFLYIKGLYPIFLTAMQIVMSFLAAGKLSKRA